MKIKDGIKAGIGFTLGTTITNLALKLLSNGMRKSLEKRASDEEYMEKLKNEDPGTYEVLKRHFKHD